MSMGYVACYDEVISEDDLITIGNCNERLQELKSVIDTVYECGINNWIIQVCTEFISATDNKPVDAAFKALREEFKIATGDLVLYIGYHDVDENGSCYDDIDGPFWAVDGMYELSKAGKKLQSKVHRRHYVNFR